MEKSTIEISALLCKDPPPPFDSAANFEKFQGYLNSKKWEWVPVLRFPIAEMVALNPWHKVSQWLTFATGVVIGAPGQLTLLGKQDQPYISDDWPQHSVYLSYYVNQENMLRMLIAEPQMGTIHSSAKGSSMEKRDAEFKSKLVARDVDCAYTNTFGRDCEGAHLISQDKPNEYIQAWTSRRTHLLLPTGPQEIGLIEDPQNGVLLSHGAHKALGRRLGFMVVPNFAVPLQDIPPDPATQTLAGPHVPLPDYACIVHVFDTVDRLFTANPGPVHYLRRPTSPEGQEQWPTPVMFDETYVQILGRFTTKEYRVFAKTAVENIYFPGGRETRETREGAGNNVRPKPPADPTPRALSVDTSESASSKPPLCTIYCIVVLHYAHALRSRSNETWQIR